MKDKIASAWADFCAIRDRRDPVSEAYKHTEKEAFELAMATLLRTTTPVIAGITLRATQGAVANATTSASARIAELEAKIAVLSPTDELAALEARDKCSVIVKLGRIWINRGAQSFMLAYEAETPEELDWYAGQLRGVLSSTANMSDSENVSLRDMMIAQAMRHACVNAYSPDDSASDWDDKIGDIDCAKTIRAALTKNTGGAS